jgi:tetratricopeptide (TPR) repeat protein
MALPCGSQESTGNGILQALPGYRDAIYRAYLAGDMDSWLAVIELMDSSGNRNEAFILELLNYRYGYIGWCLADGRRKEAERSIALAEKDIQALEKTGRFVSMTESYRSALIGFRIGLNALLAPFIGFESVERSKKAIAVDPVNPYGYIQYGNALSYMPGVFGGSKAAALDNFRTAQSLMEKHPERISRDWNYLGLLVSIAQTYEEMGEYARAREYLDAVLSREPDFKWVRDELYPALLSRMK